MQLLPFPVKFGETIEFFTASNGDKIKVSLLKEDRACYKGRKMIPQHVSFLFVARVGGEKHVRDLLV